MLPDVAQMYLPPLTMHILRDLWVYNPMHSQRAKSEARRKAQLIRSRQATISMAAHAGGVRGGAAKSPFSSRSQGKSPFGLRPDANGDEQGAAEGPPSPAVGRAHSDHI